MLIILKRMNFTNRFGRLTYYVLYVKKFLNEYIYYKMYFAVGDDKRSPRHLNLLALSSNRSFPINLLYFIFILHTKNV